MNSKLLQLIQLGCVTGTDIDRDHVSCIDSNKYKVIFMYTCTVNHSYSSFNYYNLQA